ncbi:hypothetical protein CMI37_30690 [Candidatus Pacearchaeota archaeon]|nr:hypothetical protein [Candidatus Pacearchaeota archaeon]
MKVIEYYIWNKDMPRTVLAEQTGVPYDTITRWFKDVMFLKALEKRFTESLTVDYIDCVKAMIIEAKSGNTAAFKEIKPIIQKIVPEIDKMVSPHALFLQINQVNSSDVDSIESAEIIRDPVKELQEVHIPDKVHMTPRQEKDRIEVVKKVYKKQKVNKSKRNALMKLKRRAKRVGLASLGSGRPTRTERIKWMAKLEKLEEREGIKHPSP